jgi:hypothetical protein
MMWAAPDRNRWRRGFALLPLSDGWTTIWLRPYWYRPYGEYTAVSFDKERPVASYRSKTGEGEAG